jgi:excinuclease ABC subunit A
MHFLPDVYSICEECAGTRFNQETKLIRWRGKNISDVLDMTVDTAADFFSFSKKITNILNMLKSVGLGYIKLGQSSLTFSGGEAQRIKLARELSRANDKQTLYLLDEPTTGLHHSEISLLLDVLERLVERGHSVIAIEHNIDFISSCNWIIDMGPEGGPEGGKIIAEGHPLSVAKMKTNATGQYLRPYLN